MAYVPNLRLVVPEASEMTAREEKAATVRALREEGHTNRRIGEMLGISVSYVDDLYHDPSGAAGRERLEPRRREGERHGVEGPSH
jgi:transposase